MYQLHQIRPLALPLFRLGTATHARVASRLDCRNWLYVGLPLRLTEKVQLVQNTALQVLMGTPHTASVHPVLLQLHWVPLEHWIKFKDLVLTLKALNGRGPTYSRTPSPDIH